MIHPMTTPGLMRLALSLLAAPAWAQHCQPQYVGTTSTVTSFDVIGDIIIEARPLIGLDLYDASDINNLVKLSSVPLDDTTSLPLDADGDIACVPTSNTTAQLVDISDPINPVLGGQITFSQDIAQLQIRGNIVCAITEPGGGSLTHMDIYDVSNLQAPVLLTQADTSVYRNLHMSHNAIVSRLPDNSGFQIHDITGTIQPAPSATLPGWDYASFQGDTLAVVNPDAIAFYDLSDPANPTQISIFNESPYSPGLISLVSMTYIGDYLVTHSSFQDSSNIEFFYVYDAHDPQNLDRLYTHDGMGVLFRDVRYSQPHVLGDQIISWFKGLYVYEDLSQSFASQLIQASPSWDRTVEHNGHIYGSHNGALRIGTPAPLESLEPIAELTIEPESSDYTYLTIMGFSGNTAIIESREDTPPYDRYLTAVDVSDPTSPNITDRIRFANRHAPPAILVDNHVYGIAEDTKQIRAAEITAAGIFTPMTDTPLIIDSNNILTRYSDDRLYIAPGSFSFNRTHDLLVFDLATDPLHPMLIADINHENSNLSGTFAVHDNRIYFKQRFRDFAVLDLTDLVNPAISVEPSQLPDRAQLFGSAHGMLYIAQNDYGMTTLDVSHPGVYRSYGPFNMDYADGIANSGVINYPYLDIQGILDGNTRYDISSCVPQPCPADLTGDGLLNFFDVSAFLTAFNAQDPAADFTGDDLLNFFDVSAFLTAYNAGCP